MSHAAPWHTIGNFGEQHLSEPFKAVYLMHSNHRVGLCVAYGSHNKQRLLPYTTGVPKLFQLAAHLQV
jgi:hypothetical protein